MMSTYTDIRRARSRDTIGDIVWRAHIDRADPRAHALPGWPTCECASDACAEPATTTDDSDHPVCEECQDYALDAAGTPCCAAHDARVIDAGQWTGGGMHGSGTAWVSRYIIEEED